MKVLMLGWEFPPFYAGGVGVVCFEMTKALMRLHKNIEIVYVMPFGPKNSNNIDEASHVKLLVANNEVEDSSISIKVMTVPVMFKMYMSEKEYQDEYEEYVRNAKDSSEANLYGKNLYLEVERFAQKVREIAIRENCDIIHAHDWMTIPAGIAAKEATGKPFVLHIHNTVYDRYLGQGGGHERDIEQRGCDAADLIISISNYPVSDHLINKYGVNPNKIRLIHNGGGEFISKLVYLHPYDIVSKEKKTVAYLGRMVMQKGPEFFVKAALRALEYEPNVNFLIAGNGHMVPHLKYMVEQAGRQKNFTITGKQYSREEGNGYFEMADVFVMPSVSEPFGIVPLEAVAKGTPTIISKQSGIAECMNHCFKVDYWDTDEMANKIVSLLRYNPLHAHMRELAFAELDNFNWMDRAEKIYSVYLELLR